MITVIVIYFTTSLSLSHLPLNCHTHYPPPDHTLIVPPSPLTVNSIRVNATHMNVTWRPIPLTLSRGFITQYVISYSRVATGKRQSGLVIVPGNQTFIVIGDLAADARYSVTVTAGTAAGLGDESLETIVEQSEAPQSEEFLTPTNIIILTCCIAGVLILLLAVLLIVAVCKRRSSSNKRCVCVLVAAGSMV